jgi:hypothetical protein
LGGEQEPVFPVVIDYQDCGLLWGVWFVCHDTLVAWILAGFRQTAEFYGLILEVCALRFACFFLIIAEFFDGCKFMCLPGWCAFFVFLLEPVVWPEIFWFIVQLFKNGIKLDTAVLYCHACCFL